MISLAEGNTPLIPLPNLSKELGIQLYGKYEGLNPTGSFKDRGMVMAVAKAVEEGAKAIVCASTGNTSAAAAAYATRAGIKAYVVIPSHWENWRKLLCMGRTLFRFQVTLMKH